MSKQWGHGFYKGREQALSQAGLVGLFFHSRHSDGSLHWQGSVLREDVAGSRLIVQLYSWFDGTPTKCEIVSIEQTKKWTFYATARQMRVARDKERGLSEKDIQFNERVHEILHGRN